MKRLFFENRHLLASQAYSLFLGLAIFPQMALAQEKSQQMTALIGVSRTSIRSAESSTTINGSLAKVDYKGKVERPLGHDTLQMKFIRISDVKSTSSYQSQNLDLSGERASKSLTHTYILAGTWLTDDNAKFVSDFFGTKNSSKTSSRKYELTNGIQMALTDKQWLSVDVYGGATYSETRSFVRAGGVGYGIHSHPNLKWILSGANSRYSDDLSQNSETSTISTKFIYDLAPTMMLQGALGRMRTINKKRGFYETNGDLILTQEKKSVKSTVSIQRGLKSDSQKGGVFLEDSAIAEVSCDLTLSTSVTGRVKTKQDSKFSENGKAVASFRGERVDLLSQQKYPNYFGPQRHLIFSEILTADLIRFPVPQKTLNLELALGAGF
jgi:hypothetical protein